MIIVMLAYYRKRRGGICDVSSSLMILTDDILVLHGQGCGAVEKQGQEGHGYKIL